MDQFFADYLNNLESLHTGFKSALHDLSQDGLDWNPAGETNSLTILAVHTAGSERFWIGDIVAGQSSNRNRSAEFRTRNIPAQELAARLDANLEYAREVLSGLGMADLSTVCEVPDRERSVTLGWALLHALEHTAQHTAHAQLTRQLWDQTQST